MQTREPRKRTSAILVVILIILIPLIIFILILTNTAPQQTGEKMQDSIKVGNTEPDTTQITTKRDTTKK
ncbi:MAG TPA: hypothetical protein VLB50_05445 [Ignavibacteriaceae bacterium]|nr:hypothetical protein [Ignavibacteriaceae bacterium]